MRCVASALSTADLGTGILLQQFLRTRKCEISVLQLSLSLGNPRFFCLDVGFERSPFQAIQKLSLLDVGAFRKEAFVQKRSHARDQIDAIAGFNAAVNLGAFGHRLELGLDNSHGGRGCAVSL